MKRWDQRPFEIRNLFNPAFCGLILFRALHGYEEEDSRGMPFSLSLLVLPLCLHKESREVIAGSPRSYLLTRASARADTIWVCLGRSALRGRGGPGPQRTTSPR